MMGLLKFCVWNWFCNRRLRRIENKRGLYFGEMELVTDWDFKILRDGESPIGQNCSHIVGGKENATHEATVWAGANNKLSIENILYIVNHEALHVAINSCLINGDRFDEVVIDQWMLEGMLKLGGE